jgi:hypothetical protein
MKAKNETSASNVIMAAKWRKKTGGNGVKIMAKRRRNNNNGVMASWRNMAWWRNQRREK